MTLTTARSYVLANVRNGNDQSMYDATAQDMAIAGIGNRIVEETRVTRKIDTVSLLASMEAVDFSALTGFLPEFVIGTGIRLVVSSDYTDSDCLEPLSRVSMAEIARAKARCNISSGVPRLIAFEVDTNAVESAIVWPPPKANGSLEVCWYPPFVQFTPGAGDPDSTILNVRDSIMIDALRLGGPAYLQANEPPNAENAARSETNLAAFILKQMGKGGDGSNILIRTPLRDRGYGRGL